MTGEATSHCLYRRSVPLRHKVLRHSAPRIGPASIYGRAALTCCGSADARAAGSSVMRYVRSVHTLPSLRKIYREMQPMLQPIRRMSMRLSIAVSLIATVGQPCIDAASLAGELGVQDSPQHVPAFMVRLLTDHDLIGKTPDDLDLMRNEIFARLGRRFERADLQSYFESQTWYKPRFAPSDFDASLLSSIQRQNVTILLAAARRAGRVSPVITTARANELKPTVSAKKKAETSLNKGVTRANPVPPAVDVPDRLAARPAHAELVLDKLTACNDIERVYTTLKAQPRVALSDCRPPRDGLESALASRAGAGASQLCFLRTSPAAFLDSFSCVRFISNTATPAADVTCFRAASLRDIQAYKEQYAERFARIESQYLAAAQKCAVSGGDSSNSAPVLFPPVASMLARFQLGFSASLGSGRPSDSSIFHGYGETDPEIRTSAPSAIEVVSVIVNSPARHSVPVNSRTVGDWLLQVDDTATLEREMNERYARADPPMRFSVIGYNLAREGPHGMTASAKLSVTGSLHDSIAEELQADGFEQLSESELRRQTGKSSEELVRDITRNSVPFGSRDHSVKFSNSFRMLLKETGLSCTRRGRGAVAAYLMGTQPFAGVQRDFGDILLIVARMGACSANSEARSYVKGLLDGATEDILGALGRR
jgi:hypothetical protein